MFVFPITDSDSFGIPILEAGAARCPVISTDRGPARELVKNEKTGILVKPNDIEDLKEKVLEILTNNDLERKLGDNGYKFVSENYTWEQITELTNKLYLELF